MTIRNVLLLLPQVHPNQIQRITPGTYFLGKHNQRLEKHVYYVKYTSGV